MCALLVLVFCLRFLFCCVLDVRLFVVCCSFAFLVCLLFVCLLCFARLRAVLVVDRVFCFFSCVVFALCLLLVRC